MKFLIFLTFAILFISIPLVLSQNYQPYYFKLALQWPNSYCNTQERQAPGQGCLPLLPRKFTIHGLWGQDHNGSPLPQCRTGNALRRKNEGDPIVRYLDSVWRSYTKTTNFEFWEHEWNDHGRCLEIGGRQVTRQQYFKGIYDVMIVIESMNLVTEIFEKQRLVPHDTDLYKPDRFLWAIYDRTLNIAQMDCNVDAWLRKQIYEIYFCVSLDFKLINCPERDLNPKDLPEFYTGRCGHQENSIRFPPNKYESAEPPKKVDTNKTFKIIKALISAIIPIILGFMH